MNLSLLLFLSLSSLAMAKVFQPLVVYDDFGTDYDKDCSELGGSTNCIVLNGNKNKLKNSGITVGGVGGRRFGSYGGYGGRYGGYGRHRRDRRDLRDRRQPRKESIEEENKIQELQRMIAELRGKQSSREPLKKVKQPRMPRPVPNPVTEPIVTYEPPATDYESNEPDTVSEEITDEEDYGTDGLIEGSGDEEDDEEVDGESG